MARVDYDRWAGRYQAGRGVPLADLAGWREAVAPEIRRAGGPVLDVGAGTGIWCRAFATWFGLPVVGVEPSAGMRRQALASGLGTSVVLVGGRAEQIPLAGRSVGTAWLSTVVHHLGDLDAAAAELARVLRPGGAVLIRNSFPFRHDEIPLFAYFPAARRVAEQFPTVEQVAATFAGAGFVAQPPVRVREPGPPTLADFRRWVVDMRHADSALAPLDDDEVADGLAAVDADIADGVAPTPLGLDLLVLRKATLHTSYREILVSR